MITEQSHSNSRRKEKEMIIFQVMSDIPDMPTQYYKSEHKVLSFIEDYCKGHNRWADLDKHCLLYDEDIDPQHFNLPVGGYYVVHCKDKAGDTIDGMTYAGTYRVFDHAFVVNLITVID